MGRSFDKKTCPRCGQLLYKDMSVCYGCLYDFKRKDNGPSEVVAPAAVADSAPERGAAKPPSIPAPTPKPRSQDAPARSDEEFTTLLGDEGAGVPQHCVLVRSPDLDVLVPLGPEGISVGRGSGNQVVIHDKAVSRRHLRLTPVAGGVEATDLGATNSARFRGERLKTSAVVPLGESVQVGEVAFFPQE